MWLPDDEREMLRKYRTYIGSIDEAEYFINLSTRAYNATINLIERGLIREVKEDDQETQSEHLAAFIAGDVDLKGFLGAPDEENMIRGIVLKFTIKGLELANKYSHRITKFVEWLKEYWLIVTIFGSVIGFIGGIITNRLLD